ncbi:hypothetical protein [Olivibacter sp. XZL3]|uniref:hypothetical protein n=1 Tax=Olivibacter sp. XZL3 TaxID=1735116 RepID=UPI0010651E3E|nr:hypothetical protein [Olivibacter sp. XZL3]
MKSKIYALLTVLMLAFTFSTPITAFAHDKHAKKVELSEEDAAREINAMKRRVAEIKAMDKSALTKAERKELRKELREMNKRARALGSGGVYLSVGAIIIIILVLILIL